jgi:hypothetical protein
MRYFDGTFIVDREVQAANSRRMYFARTDEKAVSGVC